jgi:O-antigen/teichoic acid export membrane protein
MPSTLLRDTMTPPAIPAAARLVAALNWRAISGDLAFVGAANFIHKLASYVVIVTLARYLHKDDIGAMFFAASIASMAAVFTELGTTRYLSRRIASDHSCAPEALSVVLTLRLPLMGLAIAILNVFVWLAWPQIRMAVALSTLYVFLQSLFFTFSAAFLAMRQARSRSLADIAAQILLVVLVFLAAHWRAGLGVVLGCYVVAYLMLVGMTFQSFRSRIGPVRLRPDAPAIREMITQSAPFFLLSSVSALHFKVDTLMLGFMTALAEVARYEIAYKFLEVSRFIVRPVVMVMLPIGMALVARESWAEFRVLTRRVLVGAVVVAAVGAVPVIMEADLILDLIFGTSYASSAPIVKVLFLSLPAVYVSVVAGVLAVALRLERRMIRITVVCLAANMLANFYAIPRWGGLGAAWCTLATETLLAVWTVALLIAQTGSSERTSAQVQA